MIECCMCGKLGDYRSMRQCGVCGAALCDDCAEKSSGVCDDCVEEER